MNQILKVFILCSCIYAISCASTRKIHVEKSLEKNDLLDKLNELQEKLKNGKLETKEDSIPESFVQRIKSFVKKEILDKVSPSNETQTVEQLSEQKENATKSLERSKRQPFYNYYDEFYPTDFLYDYYDWVCSETTCQLCNVLTSQCCNPVNNPNCRLPDSCLNNPCLSGGTCVPTLTPVTTPNQPQFPDFICVCLPGFTGKYCQLTNDYLWPPGFGGDPGIGMGGPGIGGPGIGGPAPPAPRMNVNTNSVSGRRG